MRECGNSKIHISSNFLLSICLLMMLDTLLLVPLPMCSAAAKIRWSSSAFELTLFSYILLLSLTSALDKVSGQRHAPAVLSPGKTRYPLYIYILYYIIYLYIILIIYFLLYYVHIYYINYILYIRSKMIFVSTLISHSAAVCDRDSSVDISTGIAL